MKDRLATLAGALLSLALLTALLFPQEPAPPPASRPTSQDRGELGLQGLTQWLQRNGVPTLSLRRRYSYLALHPGIPHSGNLLLSSLPHSYAADSRELEALRAWLDQGNRILVLAAINDLPDWALLEPGLTSGQHSAPLLEALGFRFHTLRRPEDAETGSDDEKEDPSLQEELLAAIETAQGTLGDLRRKELRLQPAAADALLAGVNEVWTRTSSSTTDDLWQLEGLSGRRVARPLLVDPTRGSTALWAVRAGDATIWIGSYPDMFGNRTLGEGDNARLLRNLLSAALGPGGALIFDDLHQGLSDLYDPKAFFRDPRLWNSVWFVVAFWLLYVLGHSNRLAPPVKPAPQVHASGLVEAMAGLFSRRLPAVAVGRGLLRHFFDEIREQHKLAPTGCPCWEILAANPGVPSQDLRDLQRIARRLDAGVKPNLRRLNDLLHRFRETMG